MKKKAPREAVHSILFGKLMEDWSPGHNLSVLRSCSAGVTGEDQYISDFKKVHVQ